MSFIRFSNAEGGSTGPTVTAANSGAASGYAFDAVAGGGNLTFDNSQQFNGRNGTSCHVSQPHKLQLEHSRQYDAN